MAQLNTAEQGRRKRRMGPGLQPARKKGRMMEQLVEEDALSVMPLGKTARERSMNQEKEKQKRKTREEERKKARRLMREELLAKLHKELEKEEEAEKISEWIERVQPCPLFTPTKEEFEDPLKYIERILEERPEVASKYGICKVIPPGCYVSRMFTGRTKFWDTDFRMEVRKQPLRMVDWDNRDTAAKDANFNKDTKLWTMKELEEWANKFVAKHYENSASMLQLRFIEREFWKEFLLRQNKFVRYASDVPGTAFDNWEALGRSSWNLGSLPTLPDSVLRIVEESAPPIPGVTEPMLYVGMLFSMFAWHVEDQYLYSINYHHLGAPKTWYGVPGQAAQAFERVAREKVFNLPDDEEGLARTLRLLIGKTIMFPPGLLADAGVPVCRAVQQPGEFVITFPRSYHAGFSNGFNCGEAVNFAMRDWFAYGAACTRRYRLLRQVQVVAYDELLCKEAQQLHARMHDTIFEQYEPTAMDVATMVEFVRLMRWQHWQRWELAQRKFAAEPIALVQRVSGECALCHHKNYLAYVLCDCHEGDPMCLNHPEELHACRCRALPAPDGSLFPGPTVYYTLELPALEVMAADFERQPGIADKLAAATGNEVTKAELQDVVRLGAAREELMGDGQPPQDWAGIPAYRRWAPIPGYNYGGMRAIQPATPSQQALEMSAGTSHGSRGRRSPSPKQAGLAGGSSQCMAIQSVPERLPWSPPQRTPAGSQPATPSPADTTGGRQLSCVLVRVEGGVAGSPAGLDGRMQGHPFPVRETLTDSGGAQGAEVEVAPAGSEAGVGSMERESRAREEMDMAGQEQRQGHVDEHLGPEPVLASAPLEAGVTEPPVATEAGPAGHEAAPQAREGTAAEQMQENGSSRPAALHAPGSTDAHQGKGAPLAAPASWRKDGVRFAGSDERQTIGLREVSGRGLLEGEPKAPVRVREASEDGGDEASVEAGRQEWRAEGPRIVEAAVLLGDEGTGSQREVGHCGDGTGRGLGVRDEGEDSAWTRPPAAKPMAGPADERGSGARGTQGGGPTAAGWTGMAEGAWPSGVQAGQGAAGTGGGSRGAASVARSPFGRADGRGSAKRAGTHLAQSASTGVPGDQQGPLRRYATLKAVRSGPGGSQCRGQGEGSQSE